MQCHIKTAASGYYELVGFLVAMAAPALASRHVINPKHTMYLKRYLGVVLRKRQSSTRVRYARNIEQEGLIQLYCRAD